LQRTNTGYGRSCGRCRGGIFMRLHRLPEDQLLRATDPDLADLLADFSGGEAIESANTDHFVEMPPIPLVSFASFDASMNVWPLQLPLLPDATVVREALLWDLGGQEDYRLIHRLFLDETAWLCCWPIRRRTIRLPMPGTGSRHSTPPPGARH